MASPFKVSSPINGARSGEHGDGAGETDADARASERNRLLSSLSDSAYHSLLPHLEAISLSARHVVSKPETRIHAVYFPRTAVFSLLTPLENRSPVESATTGHEGIVGVPVILGITTTHTLAVVQVAGEAARVDAERFYRWFEAQDRADRAIFFRFTHVLLEHTAQSVACNRKHALEKRCARWLLATRDRVGAQEFLLTHEFLAAMLGVRRSSVTIALGLLQAEKCISYSRGRLKILDDERLEGTSCECYRVVRAEHKRIMSGANSIDI